MYSRAPDTEKPTVGAVGFSRVGTTTSRRFTSAVAAPSVDKIEHATPKDRGQASAYANWHIKWMPPLGQGLPADDEAQGAVATPLLVQPWRQKAGSPRRPVFAGSSLPSFGTGERSDTSGRATTGATAGPS